MMLSTFLMEHEVGGVGDGRSTALARGQSGEQMCGEGLRSFVFLCTARMNI